MHHGPQQVADEQLVRREQGHQPEQCHQLVGMKNQDGPLQLAFKVVAEKPHRIEAPLSLEHNVIEIVIDVDQETSEKQPGRELDGAAEGVRQAANSGGSKQMSGRAHGKVRMSVNMLTIGRGVISAVRLFLRINVRTLTDSLGLAVNDKHSCKFWF